MGSFNLQLFDIENSTSSKENFTLDGLNTSTKNISFVLDWQKNCRRSGSAKIKQMSEISGTTAKPYKQKGTGHARQGSRRSVQFVGGRTCFGPTPRDFSYSIPKKMVRKALSDVLKLKVSDGKIVLLQNPNSFKKSSQVNSFLKENGMNSALFLHDASSETVIRSFRNIKGVKCLALSSINVYDLVRYDFIIVDRLHLATIKKIIA